MAALSKEDIVKYLIKIKLNFENSYATANDFERQLLVESWYEVLCEYPKELCDIAVNNALKRAKFAPRLGDVTEEIENLINVNSMSDEELWLQLTSVLSKSYEVSRYLAYEHYYAWANARLTQIFNSLEPEIKTYLVNYSTLVELSEMEEDSLKFEKSRFFKQLPTLRKRCLKQKETALLQATISNLHLNEKN